MLYVKYSKYVSTGAIAASLYDSVSGDLYGVITVNLPESVFLPYGVQYVDVNNYPDIEKWLRAKGIAEPLGTYACSGFCTYPAYRFNVPESRPDNS